MLQAFKPNPSFLGGLLTIRSSGQINRVAIDLSAELQHSLDA
jgi:hypothetical protein